MAAAGMTRRQLLRLIGQAGGVAALYRAMDALELIARPAPAEGAAAPLIARGDGRRVIILGAGLAGMTAAYELRKAGYDCTILEARDRAGGRCWTVRRGTVETEIGGERQVCDFDDGLYFNPGPARIPHHHRALLGYCKEFGVALETFINDNGAAYYYQQEGREGAAGPLAGQKLRQRAARADLRGGIAALLGKAVSQGALDTGLTADDRDRLLDVLRAYGDLAGDYSYGGSSRRGYRTPPGAGAQAGALDPPAALGPLLQARVWRYLASELAYDQGPTMLQPVGGMDRIARAFEERVRTAILYECEALEIRRTPEGVRVPYLDRWHGLTDEMTADFCVCTLPLPVLAGIPTDLPPEVADAARRVRYEPAIKVGVACARRFWEDEEEIYGGITWTNQPIRQLWYPSAGYHAPGGVLVGMYAFGQAAVEYGRLSPSDRRARVIEQGATIHPQLRDEARSAFSVAWQNVRHSQGCYASYSRAERDTLYAALQRHDGRIFLAGEHLSHLPGWQEGAVLSARATVAAIGQRVAGG